VAAIEGAHRRGDVPARNPVARAFQRAVDEMAALSPWLGGGAETARGLAGLGDLHVTVGGGRNSRLGRLLGEGVTIADALAGPMRGETVEGVDVGRALAAGLAGGQPTGPLRLTRAVLAAIEGAPFDASSALRTA
jgi:glycerol-3-phosphate dehydrogenase (NAD(P)+)